MAVFFTCLPGLTKVCGDELSEKLGAPMHGCALSDMPYNAGRKELRAIRQFAAPAAVYSTLVTLYLCLSMQGEWR
eukprot:scaffold5499_cov202-Prasinococcus_capsulatus_cf.AAC.1